jgi:hypothetical protein
MTGAFVLAQHAESNKLDWGSVTWYAIREASAHQNSQ